MSNKIIKNQEKENQKTTNFWKKIREKRSVNPRENNQKKQQLSKKRVNKDE